jgi:hypothetical protein
MDSNLLARLGGEAFFLSEKITSGEYPVIIPIIIPGHILRWPPVTDDGAIVLE